MGMIEGYRYERSKNGFALRKDGTHRIDVPQKQWKVARRETERVLGAHRMGSLGEDQESVVV